MDKCKCNCECSNKCYSIHNEYISISIWGWCDCNLNMYTHCLANIFANSNYTEIDMVNLASKISLLNYILLNCNLSNINKINIKIANRCNLNYLPMTIKTLYINKHQYELKYLPLSLSCISNTAVYYMGKMYDQNMDYLPPNCESLHFYSIGNKTNTFYDYYINPLILYNLPVLCNKLTYEYYIDNTVVANKSSITKIIKI